METLTGSEEPVERVWLVVERVMERVMEEGKEGGLVLELIE